MDHTTTNKLDRLLADGELSGPEADAIFERVHAAVVHAERPRRTYAAGWLAGGLAACAAAAFLLLLRPAAEPRAELTARGIAGDAPRLEAVCSHGTLASCPVSSNLTFVVTSTTTGFLSAYAEPLDGQTERVWYFSSDTQSPGLTGAGDGTQVFDQAVRLAGTHRPGRYRIHAFLAGRPLTRSEMLAHPNAEVVRASTRIDLVIQD